MMRTAFIILLGGLIFASPVVASSNSLYDNKVTICHVPPNDRSNAYELDVSRRALIGHLGHGDYVGACVRDAGEPCESGECSSDSGPDGGDTDSGVPIECFSDRDCDDGIFCNGEEGCSESGHCTLRYQQQPCDYCDEEEDICYECIMDSECSDNLFCNGSEFCQSGFCASADSPCGEEEICDEFLERCTPEGSPCDVTDECDNGFFCDGAEKCVDRECVGGFPPCIPTALCIENARSCLGPTGDAGVVINNDAGTGDPRRVTDSFFDPTDVNTATDDENSEDGKYLSGSSFLTCNSTEGAAGTGLVVALLFSLLLFLRRRALFFNVTFILFLALPAMAEGTNQFEITSGPDDYLITPDPRTPAHMQQSGRIMLDWSKDPLVFRNNGGAEIGKVIESRLGMQAVSSLGLFDNLELKLGMPIAYLNGPGLSGEGVEGLAFGDPRLAAKWNMNTVKRMAVALQVQTSLPLARFNASKSSRLLMGDDSLTVTPSLMVSHFSDVIDVGLQLGHSFRKPQQISDLNLGSSFNAGVGVRVKPLPFAHVLTDMRGRLGYPIGGLDLFSSRVSFPVELNVALESRPNMIPSAGINLPFTVLTGVGTGFMQDIGTPDMRFFVGIGWNSPAEEPHECSICEEAERINDEVEVVERSPEPLVSIQGNKLVFLEDVRFDFDSFELTDDSILVLDGLASVLKKNPSIVLEIQGHTDPVGSKEYNRDLAWRRAITVRRYLIDKGVPSTHLLPRSYGEEHLLLHRLPDIDKLNRRVSFRVLAMVIDD